MFKDLDNKIENYYKLIEPEKESILLELNTRINREPEEFKMFMQSYGYGLDVNRSIFYEAITKSNPNKWSDYLFAELKLLIEKAEEGNENACDDLSSIYWLIDIPDMDKEYYNRSKTLLIAKLNSNNAEVREQSLAGISDLFDHLKEKPTAGETTQLQECLKDSNFKNKVYAYSELKEADLLPKDFKFSIVEKIRIKLQGYSTLTN